MLGRFLLVEQVEGDVPQDGQVLEGIIFAHPAIIFPEGDIQDEQQRSNCDVSKRAKMLPKVSCEGVPWGLL